MHVDIVRGKLLEQYQELKGKMTDGNLLSAAEQQK